MKIKFYEKNNSRVVKRDFQEKFYSTFALIILFLVVKMFVPITFSSIDSFFASFANFGNFNDATIGSANIPISQTFTDGISLLLSTLYIGITGTILGILLSIPLAILSSKTINKNSIIVQIIRFIMSILRATPPLLYAYLLANLLSSSFTGVITITIFVMTIMTKWLYEDIDSLVYKPYELFIASGLSSFDSFRAAILPFLRQKVITYGLYAFEISIKFSAILGVVGIVGIGRLFERYQTPENWGHLLVVLLLLLCLILLIEFIKNYIIDNTLNHRGEERDDNQVNKSYTPIAVRKLRIVYLSTVILFAISIFNIKFSLASTSQVKLFNEDISKIFSPDWSYLTSFGTGENAIELGFQAFLVAIDSIFIALLISVPLGIFASKKISSKKTVQILRALIAVLRVIPLYIYAIIFVVLSPDNKFVFAGSLALGFASIGSLSKLIFESVDSINENSINLMKASGMNKIEIIRVAVLPKLVAPIISQGLYRLEINFKESLVIGTLGASAFGYQMVIAASQSNNYDQLLSFLFVTIFISLLIEQISNLIRNKVLNGYWTKSGSKQFRIKLEKNKIMYQEHANRNNISYDENDINDIYDAYLISQRKNEENL